MSKRKRAIHERTDDWAQLRLLLQWPEQVTPPQHLVYTS